jgi:Ohr subfamily peroxiredoxin
MNSPAKILYTGKVHTTGGRDGAARSDDGRLHAQLSGPGSSGPGTNPEQLFAAGWSACFLSAIKIAADKAKVALPTDVAVDAEVDLGVTSGVYDLQTRLNVTLPGIAPAVARQLVETAHQTCPYSRATRGNINVAISVA